MHRFALGLLLAATLTAPAAWADLTNVDCPTDNTTCTLLDAGAAIHPRYVIISADTEDDAYLSCDGDTDDQSRVGPLHLGDNTTGEFNLDEPNRATEFFCPAGEDFRLIKGTAGTPVTVFFTYDQ